MPYVPPARLAYWESRLPYVNGVDRPYAAGAVDPDGGGGYYLDGDDHYDPARGFRRVQAYSIAKGLPVTDYSVQILAAQVRIRDRAIRAVNATVENGETPGVQDYHRQLDGIADHYLEAGDPADVEAADILLAADAFVPAQYRESYDHTGLQREAAFVLKTALDRERMGLGEHSITDAACEVCLSHVSQWVAEAPRYGVWLKPFMGALAARGLIAYWERYRNSAVAAKVANCAAIPPAVKALCDYMWTDCWYPAGTPVDIGGGTMWDKGAITYRDIANADPRWVPITGNAITAVVNPRRIVRGPATLSTVDDYYKGAAFVLSGVADAFQIIAYTGATREITLSNYYTLPLDATTAHTFTIRPTAYVTDEGPGPAPDLNHMVFPAFAWACWHEKTIGGDQAAAATYRTRAHAVFDGCTQSWQDAYQQKIWNQSAFWTTDGLGWLEAADIAAGGILLIGAPMGGVLAFYSGGGSGGGGTDPDPDPGPFAAPDPPALIDVHHSHDQFADPCDVFDVYVVKDGNWSDPATWSLRVPTATDRVVIHEGTVTVDTPTCVAGPVLVMGTGKLQHSYIASNLLTCDDLIGIGSAEWHCHGVTEADPFPAHLTAGVTLRDTPLGSAASDPRQHRRGIIWVDTTRVRLRGAPKTCRKADIRLSVEPLAGHATLTFEVAPTGWRAGDMLVVPPTSPYWWDGLLESNGFDYRFEEVTVASIAGNVVTLTAPLARNHRGITRPAGTPATLANDPARPAPAAMLPHVANATRNVVLRSANPAGTRGHMILGARCDGRLHNVLVRSMGRTFGSNPFGDGTTSAHHVNQKGRYAIHRHHNYGAVNPSDTGHQGEVVGCVVHDSRKWPVAIHGTSHQKVEGNLLYWWQHSGIAGEDGNEAYNDIDQNVIMGGHTGNNLSPTSTVGSPASHEADWPVTNCIWFLGPAWNNVTNNVGAGGRGSLYLPHFWHLDRLGRGGSFGNVVSAGGIASHPYPLHRGADVMHGVVGVDFEYIPLDHSFWGETGGNECYAMSTGISVDHFTGDLAGGPLHYEDFTAWRLYHNATFVYGGLQDITLDRITAWGNAQYGMGMNTQDAHIQIQNVDIRMDVVAGGLGVGYTQEGNSQFTVTLRDSYIYSRTPVEQFFPALIGVGVITDEELDAKARINTFRNVVVQNHAGQSPPVYYKLAVLGGSTVVPCLDMRILVYDHQGNTADDFRLYFVEQHPDAILPAESQFPPTAPPPNGQIHYGGVEVGQTNAQAFAEYGLCFGAALVPPGAAGPNPTGYPGSYKIAISDPED